MNYYQLLPNEKSSKWKGYQNPSGYVWNGDERLSERYLYKLNSKWGFERLEYKNLIEGQIPPIHSLGSCFIMFDAGIPNIISIESHEVQLFPIFNNVSSHKYYIMNSYGQVDCVDWEKSDVSKWKDDEKLEEWHNKRGRWFFTPILIRNKIPNNLDAFRLREWGSAFNIFISERLKEKICNLDFDKSFLKFKGIEIV